jgi:hypothetical protein
MQALIPTQIQGHGSADIWPRKSPASGTSMTGPGRRGGRRSYSDPGRVAEGHTGVGLNGA